MRVVITGAGGFVGREIVKRLLVRGDQVVGIDTVVAAIPTGAELIAGDLGDPAVRAAALSGGLDALIHLATVPGGAAEADPSASRRINVDAMYDLLLEARAAKPGLRVIYASSIAVFGDPFPADGVDDATPLSPKMIYGGHKAMMEDVIAMMHNRGEIQGFSLRLPGILARPKGPSGMKSAFISNIFHALKAGEAFVAPVSAEATLWAQSVKCCAENFIHALDIDGAAMPATRALTLPAQRVTMVALAQEIARQCGVSLDLVSYQPDEPLEAAFGRQPALSTPAADACGYVHDGCLQNLVASALSTLE
jgi:D-erythronate 2-dehydrogenase